MGVKSMGNMIISGTRGFVEVKAPWWKTSSFEVHYEDASADESFFSRFLGDGLRYEISEFLRSILGQRSSYLTEEESIRIAGIMEKFRSDGGYR